MWLVICMVIIVQLVVSIWLIKRRVVCDILVVGLVVRLSIVLQIVWCLWHVWLVIPCVVPPILLPVPEVCLICLSIWFIVGQIEFSILRLILWRIVLLIVWLIIWLTERLIEWLIEWLIIWLIERLII